MNFNIVRAFLAEPAPSFSLLRRVFGWLLLAAFAASSATAEQLPQPEGRVILTVSGNINNTNGDGVAKLDRAMLESLGTEGFTTKTPWTNSANRFDGPLMRDVLKYVGAGTDTFHLIAHDDYQVHVTGVDFDAYPVVLAMKSDGRYMRLRNKGPLWMVFPWDDNPELHQQINSSLSVWSIKQMVVD